MKGKVFVTRNNFKKFKESFEEEIRKDASCVFLVIDDYSDKDLTLYHDYFIRILVNNVLCVRNHNRMGVTRCVEKAKAYFEDKLISFGDVFVSVEDEE